MGELIEQVRGMFLRVRLSSIEKSFLIAAILFALLVAYFYIAKVQPRRSELGSLEWRERGALERLAQATEKKKKLEQEQANASQIIASVDEFERRLKDRQQGTSQIINEVNRLARAHRVSTGDYAYRLVEAEVPVENNAAPSGRRDDKQLNVYTVLGIDTTVVGDYADLRRLISALERNPHFVVINAVAFQGEAEGGANQARPGIDSAQPASNSSAIRVSLKVEMETYFRNQLAQ